MNRTDLQQLAEIRITEAGALLSLPVPMPNGAYYLAGYAVELGLKACIAKLVNRHDWPEKKFVDSCHTHNVSELVRLAGLTAARDAEITANAAFGLNWQIVKDWNEASRYGRHALLETQKLYNAITHQTNGVFPWIKARW